MQIFILDKDIETCVKYHCDKHIVKQVLESAQLLCWVFHEQGIVAPYKLGKSHYKHPCYLWVKESQSNFERLLSFLSELLIEYTYRYDKTHKTSLVFERILDNKDKISLPKKWLTNFAQAIPDEYKNKDIIKAYRDYYIWEKHSFAKWKKRQTPERFIIN